MAEQEPQPSGGQIQRLERRLARLEAQVEDLQDALHRAATRHDARVEALERRTDPAEIARSLSEDARRRGL